MGDDLPWQLLLWETTQNFDEWPTLRVFLPLAHTLKPPRVRVRDLSYAGTSAGGLSLGSRTASSGLGKALTWAWLWAGLSVWV